MVNWLGTFKGGSVVKNSTCNAGDTGSIPGSGKSPGEANGEPTQVFLPGKFRKKTMAGYRPWSVKLSILKSRDITLPAKVRIVKTVVFPVVMCGYESWTIKQAEHWKTDAFKQWSWRRLLRVSWTARISNRPILKEINAEYSLEALMLKLKLQYFGHLMRRDGPLEKTLMLGKIEGKRRKVQWRRMAGWLPWLNGHESEQTPGESEGQRSLVYCSPWGCKQLDTTEWLYKKIG